VDFLAYALEHSLRRARQEASVRQLSFLVCMGLVLAVKLSRAQASEEHVSSSPAHEDHVMAGVKGVTVSEVAHTRAGSTALNGYGAAGFGEATLMHDQLALELDFVITTPGDEMSWAAEPLVKLPFHVGHWFEPYIAAGPVFMHIRDGHGERYWLGGAQLVAGAYAWLADALGLDIDVSLGAAHGPEMSMMEMVFAVGPVLRD
jgi:hypothetical protein